jgi:hypothetical protein
MASAPCAPTKDLLSEIGPRGDVLVGMLLNHSHPAVGTLNEKRTPASVTTNLAPAGTAPPAVPLRVKLGRGVAEGEDEGESRAMPTTASIIPVPASATSLACRTFISYLFQTRSAGCVESDD